MDITSRHEGEAQYGYDVWFSGHRNGESGVQNPNTDDIMGEFDPGWRPSLWIPSAHFIEQYTRMP